MLAAARGSGGPGRAQSLVWGRRKPPPWSRSLQGSASRWFPAECGFAQCRHSWPPTEPPRPVSLPPLPPAPSPPLLFLAITQIPSLHNARQKSHCRSLCQSNIFPFSYCAAAAAGGWWSRGRPLDCLCARISGRRSADSLSMDGKVFSQSSRTARLPSLILLSAPVYLVCLPAYFY